MTNRNHNDILTAALTILDMNVSILFLGFISFATFAAASAVFVRFSTACVQLVVVIYSVFVYICKMQSQLNEYHRSLQADRQTESACQHSCLLLKIWKLTPRKVVIRDDKFITFSRSRNWKSNSLSLALSLWTLSI